MDILRREGTNWWGAVFVFLPSDEDVKKFFLVLQTQVRALQDRKPSLWSQLPSLDLISVVSGEARPSFPSPPHSAACVCWPGYRAPSHACRSLRFSETLETMPGDSCQRGRRAVFATSSPLPPSPFTFAAGQEGSLLKNSAPAVQHVVDCLYTQLPVWDSALGVYRQCNVPVSAGVACARASLAGRGEKGGFCVRLCTKDAFHSRRRLGALQHPSSLADWTSVVLTVAAIGGVSRMQRLPLLHPPPPSVVSAALTRLWQLGLLDEQGRLVNPEGLWVSQGILKPELARLLSLSARPVCESRCRKR